MLNKFKSLTQMLVMLPVLLVENASALAQNKLSVTQFDSWVLECRSNTEATKQERCVLIHNIVKQEGEGQRTIGKITIVKESDGKAKMNILAPLGIDLSAGMSFGIDRAKPAALSIKTCLPQGCISSIPLDAQLLKSVKSGEKLVFTFLPNRQTQRVTIAVSLKGLAQALKSQGL